MGLECARREREEARCRSSGSLARAPQLARSAIADGRSEENAHAKLHAGLRGLRSTTRRSDTSSPRARSRCDRARMTRRRLALDVRAARFAPVVLLALALGFAGCGAREPERPNVILIDLDTFRGDRVGLYETFLGGGAGANGVATPHLDRAGEGRVVLPERVRAGAAHAPVADVDRHVALCGTTRRRLRAVGAS